MHFFKREKDLVHFECDIFKTMSANQTKPQLTEARFAKGGGRRWGLNCGSTVETQSARL